RSETVHINVNDVEMEASARRFLDGANANGDIRFHHFPTNDAWCRDHGAIILKHRDGRRSAAPRLATDWDYNAWGNKYPPYDLDNITRFVSQRTIVTAVEDDRSDENHKPLAENFERMRSMSDLDGRPFEIVTIPMPPPVAYEGQRLPASYANFYIANKVVLLP